MFIGPMLYLRYVSTPTFINQWNQFKIEDLQRAGKSGVHWGWTDLLTRGMMMVSVIFLLSSWLWRIWKLTTDLQSGQQDQMKKNPGALQLIQQMLHLLDSLSGCIVVSCSGVCWNEDPNALMSRGRIYYTRNILTIHWQNHVDNVLPLELQSQMPFKTLQCKTEALP